MLTKNIKHPYIKLLFDIIGIISSIGFLLWLIYGFYIRFDNNKNIELGIEWTGNSLLIGIILIFLIFLCAVASVILKSRK
ncbi:TPA: hypothetical protein RZF61_002720 [Staphylococcus aureus]|nr:hypothetical protein [Staphylococcus aureus]MBH4712192.1 hypothetical protein [Staphylococcus aureus]MBH4726208.1 hypothetical protein [Staphylococcus aureus]HDP5874006.1 hypothetical protein [Staphylococcus aureus]HEB5837548.1 hypothetical protein [Staphylococcus aureus]